MNTTAFRLYDSFRREKVAFEPLIPGRASVYLCVPTIHGDAHVGHAHSAICFDTIRRALGFLGYTVRFVRNIADVDVEYSHEHDENPVARSDAYSREMACFGIQPPDVEPRVSQHMGEIVALVERLIAGGNAYAVDGNVYYAVASFPAYGQLSGQSRDHLVAVGAPLQVGDKKRATADFALWKAAKPGEPSWASPWGPGRPGWHIECSAMCRAHLGDTFDIHCGGRELIFPHHENEIAQSQGAAGPGTFARYWMHNGFLNFVGDTKSFGKAFFNCTEIAAFAGAEAMRFYVVAHHYRSPAGFEVANENGRPAFRDLTEADKRLDYLYATLRRIDALATAGDGSEVPLLPGAHALREQATAALADDFNTPLVVAALGETAKFANRLLDEDGGIATAARQRTLVHLGRELRAVGDALGLLADDPIAYQARRRHRLAARRGVDNAQVAALVTARAEARTAKAFDRADAARDALKALGVEVLDSAAGVDWRIIE